MDSPAAGATRLRPSEAEALWRAWAEAGDARARDRLVLSYAPMVRYLATRKVRELPNHTELDDLISCGLLALIEAVDRFDPVKGATFEQYAWTRVSGAIVDELRRQDWAPRSVRRLGHRLERTEEQLYARNGAAPSSELLASTLGIEPDEVTTVREELERADVLSLNAPARGSDDSLPLEVGDTVVSMRREGSPEQVLLARERSARVRAAIESLADREREVLTLVHVHHLPGAEIARRLGISESRVSQILGGVRARLQEELAIYDRETTATAVSA